VTVRPSFGDKGAIYAYRTEILWDEAASRLVFREAERVDADFSQYGEVAVPNQSGQVYLVTNRHGQHRLITLSRPMISGEMYGVIATLLAGRGSLLTPVAAPIALLPVKSVPMRPMAGSERATRAAQPTATIYSGSRASHSPCSCREPAGFFVCNISCPCLSAESMIPFHPVGSRYRACAHNVSHPSTT
jgi:hypothetical protein